MQTGHRAAHSALVVVVLHLGAQLEDVGREGGRLDAVLELVAVVLEQAVQLFQVRVRAENLQALVVERLHPDLPGVISDRERQDQAVVELGRIAVALVATEEAVVHVHHLLVARLAALVEARLSCGGRRADR